jgi:AmiR/NasT family two-component response regulator
MLAQGIADSSAAILDGVRSLADATLVIAQLRTALDSRVFIEQAKGIVAERLNVSVGAAFEHLRRSARTQRRSLTALCEEVTRSRNVIDPLVGQIVHDGKDHS